MKKKLRFFSCLLIATCCFMLGLTDVGAATVQPRAVRHNFDFYLNSNGGVKRLDFVPSYDELETQGYRYIRVRFEPGTGGGDNIDVSAFAGAYYNGKIGTKTLHVPNLSQGAILDFKAPNAPTRSDATYTVNCTPKTVLGRVVSTNDYCIAAVDLGYGIEFYNGSTSGGNPRIYGGFSFEN